MVFRLSILISLLLLGIGGLYLRKREGWAWDKIIRLFTVAIIIIVAAVSVGIFIFLKTSEKPEIQTSFWNINLESSKQTIKFIKGPPAAVTDGGYWLYISKIKGFAEIYFIRFRDDRLWLAGYMQGGSSSGPGIQGIKQGSRLDDVIKFFGEPSHITDINSDRNRLYLYDKYNVFFVVEDRSVSFYGVYNPKEGPFIIKETFEKQVNQMRVDS